MYALLDGKKLLAVIVFLLNLVPFAANLVSTVLRNCSCALPDCRAQYGFVPSIVMLDSEICTTILLVSEGFALRCAVIRQHIWQCSDVFVRCA